MDYFRWQPAPSVPAILMCRTAMAEMESEVIRGLKSLPKRGAEVGGVLLGTRNPETGEFVIDGFEPIPIEYESGPSYILSDRDIAVWRERIADLRQKQPGFIGIYRSQTRPGLMVMPEDCAMVERFLPREEGVLLLVKPLSATESMGAFFHCDGGAVLDEAVSARQFPFSAPQVPVPEPPAPAPRGRKIPLWVPLSAAVTGIAMGLFFHYRQNRADENPVPAAMAVPAAVPASLHLRVEADGSNARIEWDRDSPLLTGATGATLNVADGNIRKALRLTEADLRNGYVEWSPRSPEIGFELQVGSASESVRWVNSRYPINSSSDRANPKPPPRAAASPPSGDGNETSRPLAAKTQQPGRAKRILNGITSKASHLWPFHSAKPARQTQ